VSDSVTLTIAGREFPCRRTLPMWQLMKMTKAMKSSDMSKQMIGMYDAVLSLVTPDVREDLDEYLSDVDVDPEEFAKVIGEALQKLAGRPKDSETPSSSSPFLENPSPSSQVVSLQPDISPQPIPETPTMDKVLTPEEYRAMTMKFESARKAGIQPG